MEAKPSAGVEGQQRAAEVPESEKPSVPLNSLKLMFEKGENQGDKVGVFLSNHHLMSDTFTPRELT